MLSSGLGRIGRDDQAAADPARRTATPLRVGGRVPLTTTDYPGKLACVVFVQGCPWRCAYCHNPHLQPRRAPVQEDWRDVRAFLERRAGLLDAVVFSGGEPTVDRALPAAIREVRALGFAVGLHTAGAYPARLAAALPLVDWVGMDVKADLAGYDRVTRTHGSAARAAKSIELLLASWIDHELRTTYHPSLLGEAQLLALAETLAGMGARRYALQAFRPQGCDAPGLAPAHVAVPADVVQRIAQRFTQFVVRGFA
jgi:anaerobic ribonucleoside-triphosphate reductase activating protein